MRLLYLFMLSVVALSNANAANIWCRGSVTNAYIDAGNNLVILGTWRNGYTRICKTDGSTGIDTVTCSIWFSLATTSMVHDKEVILMYSDNNGTMNCDSIPTYDSAPNPTYLMLVK